MRLSKAPNLRSGIGHQAHEQRRRNLAICGLLPNRPTFRADKQAQHREQPVLSNVGFVEHSWKPLRPTPIPSQQVEKVYCRGGKRMVADCPIPDAEFYPLVLKLVVCVADCAELTAGISDYRRQRI